MRRSIPVLMTTVTALAPAAVAVAAASAAATHTYRGPSTSMRWGPVAVTITVIGRRVTAISATAPTERPRSKIINGRAVPALRSEALAAQSYRIHAVSGATLTSQAFDASLHAALHAAHLAA
jgi:uncharacterized protein with FMN-binding domain